MSFFFFFRSNLESSLLDHPELALLFYLCQMMLRELGKCSRLVQLIPMDMTGYFGQLRIISVTFFISTNTNNDSSCYKTITRQ